MPTYSEELQAYIREVFSREDRALKAIRQGVSARGMPDIGIQPEEGRFLQFLTACCRARKVIEIGTLGGYSGCWIARGLQPDGKLITIEKSSKHAQVAKEHFERAGVAQQVEILIGDAHQLLPKLADQAPFDLVFIDADKSGYVDYYNWAVENVRPAGIICAHNAFRGGRILENDAPIEVSEIDDFNRGVAADLRVISTIFPAGDGTLVAVKRE